MAKKCLYNGYELPDIYEVYTPELQKTYPYAVMVWVSEYGSTLTSCLFWAFSKPHHLTYYNSTQKDYNIKPGTGETFLASKSQRVKGEYQPFTAMVERTGEDVPNGLTSKPDWANYDVMDENGGLHLGKSDPIPVGSAPEVEPKAFMNGWDIGQFVRAMVPNIVAPDVPVEPDEPEVPPYTPVEYIQFTGSQYIDTGVICNQDSKLEMTFTREESDARYLFGVSSSDNKASFTGYQSGVNSGSWRFGGAYDRPSVEVDTKHTFTMDKTGITMDGAKKRYTGTVGTFTTPQSLVLGGCNSASGTVGSILHIGKFYGCKIWDGDELVRDYIPAINPDGVYGFWEAVTEQFIQSPTDTPFGGSQA